MIKIGWYFLLLKEQSNLLALFTAANIYNTSPFRFYNGIDQSTDITANTLVEFYEDIKKVSVDSLEFHIYRGDFENWLKDACNESEFAQEVVVVKDADLKGEELRAELLKVLDAKYGIQELL